MRKIADTQALRHELEKILAYASLPRPSREKIASDLRALSVRVAADDPDEYVSDLHEIATHDLEKIFRKIGDPLSVLDGIVMTLERTRAHDRSRDYARVRARLADLRDNVRAVLRDLDAA